MIFSVTAGIIDKYVRVKCLFINHNLIVIVSLPIGGNKKNICFIL